MSGHTPFSVLREQHYAKKAEIPGQLQFEFDPDPFNDDTVIEAVCDTENPETCESCM